MAEQSHQKQFKEMMEEFTKTLKSNDSPKPGNQSGSGGNQNGIGKEKQKKKCPHCCLEVYHKLEKCLELEANASKRPEGGQVRSISLK